MGASMANRDRAPEVRRDPNLHAARLRNGAEEKIAAGLNRSPTLAAMLNHAEVLLYAASCRSCAFRDLDGTCRAWPPRPLQDGRPIWPRVTDDHWCGLWGAA